MPQAHRDWKTGRSMAPSEIPYIFRCARFELIITISVDLEDEHPLVIVDDEFNSKVTAAPYHCPNAAFAYVLDEGNI